MANLNKPKPKMKPGTGPLKPVKKNSVDPYKYSTPKRSSNNTLVKEVVKVRKKGDETITEYPATKTQQITRIDKHVRFKKKKG